MSLDRPDDAVQDTPYTYSLTFNDPRTDDVFFSTAESPSSPRANRRRKSLEWLLQRHLEHGALLARNAATGASDGIDVTVTPKTTGLFPTTAAVPDASGGTTRRSTTTR